MYCETSNDATATGERAMQTIEILKEFFLEAFQEDAAGVADWAERKGVDIEGFLKSLDSLDA